MILLNQKIFSFLIVILEFHLSNFSSHEMLDDIFSLVVEFLPSQFFEKIYIEIISFIYYNLPTKTRSCVTFSRPWITPKNSVNAINRTDYINGFFLCKNYLKKHLKNAAR